MRATISRSAGSAVRTVFALDRRNPLIWLTLGGVLLVAAIIACTAFAAFDFRERALSNTERELENNVLLLTRHFDRELHDFEGVQRDVVRRIELLGISSPEEFAHQMSGSDFHKTLEAVVGTSSDTAGINVFDSDGRLINSSQSWPVPEVSIADRNYFKTLAADDKSPAVLLAPVKSRFTGGWTTVIARKVMGPNGQFLGIVSRGISPANLETFFQSLAIGAGSAITLLHRDGTLIARYPHIEDMIGRNFRTSPVQQLLSKAEHGTIRLISPIDGEDRLASTRALSEFPLSIISTSTIDHALADWRLQTRFLIGIAALSALVIASTLFLVVRKLSQLHANSEQRLESEKQRLDTALNNMTQGLVLYDASARVVVFNQRYIDMYGLSAEIVKPGCHFYDLIQHRKETGSFKGDVDEFCSNVLRNVAEGKVTQNILKAGDGRSVQIINKPLPQGGWVVTIEDITQRLNLEQERDRNYAFLHQIIDHIPSQITVKDAGDRRYLLVNRIAETQFGMPRAAIVGKTAADLFPKASAEIIAADDDDVLKSPDGLFLDERPWESQAMGPRYITSKRIGIRDQAGHTRYIVNVVDDVTDRRRANEKIAHLAHYDALTDLPNRLLFLEQMRRELRRAHRGEQFALLYIDIDKFKGINDSLGHLVGDELLKTVATRLKAAARQTDFIARLGGDEFAVIQTNVQNTTDVVEFVSRIQENLRQPYQCLGHQLSTDASIGITMAPGDATDPNQLIKNADLAMYGAKAEGRGTHRFFEPAMDARAKARLTMEQDLRQAMVDGGFEIHYQPLVDLRSDAVIGCEALLRWRHPERGMVSPAEFIPLAEDTGLIDELGDWVMRTACAEAATWPSSIRLAVNVSPVQLKSPTLALRIARALAASGLSPERLEIEITEAVLIHDDETALAILHQLRALGVRIALDDFGTGFSSLSYLKRFPFDKIKIDRCFVSDIEVDGSAAIVQAVVNIAAARNMTTTAEGVETEMQREVLRKLGCDQMQGYLFSRPKPAAEIRDLLQMASSVAAA